jgi:hypothetical protein
VVQRQRGMARTLGGAGLAWNLSRQPVLLRFTARVEHADRARAYPTCGRARDLLPLVSAPSPLNGLMRAFGEPTRHRACDVRYGVFCLFKSGSRLWRPQPWYRIRRTWSWCSCVRPQARSRQWCGHAPPAAAARSVAHGQPVCTRADVASGGRSTLAGDGSRWRCASICRYAASSVLRL